MLSGSKSQVVVSGAPKLSDGRSIKMLASNVPIEHRRKYDDDYGDYEHELQRDEELDQRDLLHPMDEVDELIALTFGRARCRE